MSPWVPGSRCGDLGRQLRIGIAGLGEFGAGLARIAPGGIGLGAGGLQADLCQGADQGGLAVVGDLPFADQGDLVLGLQALDQRVAIGLCHHRRLGERRRRGCGSRDQGREADARQS